MSRLRTSKRARLPDRAFAYVDSRGGRRLPIHDKAHAKNALALFHQVLFENDAARERARKRLLNAAKKYRIVPVGFITGQLQSERRHATAQIQAFYYGVTAGATAPATATDTTTDTTGG